MDQPERRTVYEPLQLSGALRLSLPDSLEKGCGQRALDRASSGLRSRRRDAELLPLQALPGPPPRPQPQSEEKSPGLNRSLIIIAFKRPLLHWGGRLFVYIYLKSDEYTFQFLWICRNCVFSLDKSLPKDYDHAQDRGARFISTFLQRSSIPQEPKGNIAEAKESSCAFFRWAAGEDPPDCHASGALSSTVACWGPSDWFLAVDAHMRLRLFVLRLI